MAGFLQVTGNVSVGTTSDTITVPVTNPASAGNTLIGVAKGSLGGVTSSVTDSTGLNTWTVDASGLVSDGPTCAIFRSVLTAPLTTSDTITVTLSNSAAYNTAAIICEYEGEYATKDVSYDDSEAEDVTSYEVTASAATQHDGELVVAGVGIGGTPSQSGAFSVTASTPSMVLRAQSPASPGENNAAMADGTATGTVTPSVTWAWSDSNEPVAVIASYITPDDPGTATVKPAPVVAVLVAAGAI